MEDAQDGEKEINNEQDELEQHKVDDDVTTAVESHNEVDTTNSALENQDKPDIIENIEGGDSNVREGEGHGSAGEVPGDQTLENTVGVSVALEPLEDIIEEEEGEVEEEQGVEPVDREELLAKTKVVTLVHCF